MEHRCNDCDRNFNSQESLDQHNSMKHSGNEKKPAKFKKYFMFSMIGLIIVLSVLTVNSRVKNSKGPGEYDDFAKCVKDSGLKMYGSMTCSVCARQKRLFGSAFKYIGEIECHPRGENPQTELCFEKEISKTPTWILEDGDLEIKKLEGYQTIETLSEVSGCSLDLINGVV